MRAALIVGIDDYPDSPLQGCVNDAQRIDKLLSINDDHSPNFSTELIISSKEHITRPVLRSSLNRLFSCNADIVVFYFSGHGAVDNHGGYLVTQDAIEDNEGIPMSEILVLVHHSRAREVVIILDCCHSGAFGSFLSTSKGDADLREGMSILCSSRSSEPSLELSGSGLFSALVCEALYGGATNLLGLVTVADVYAFVDRNLGPWDQRPLFKANLSRLEPLRRCDPTIDISVLRRLPEFFPAPEYKYKLSPSYEPSERSADKKSIEVFNILKAYRAAGLLEPVGEVDMYFAAIKSKPCRLTKLGQYYWHLAKAQKI